LYQQ
jgi:glutaredoxin-like YruB-family protein